MALIAWYKLDGDALDSSGNGHHGTASGATWTGGKIGQCGKLTGALSTSIPSASWSVATHSVTLSGWFKFIEADVISRLGQLTYTYNTPTGTLLGYNNYGGFALTWEATHNSGTFSNFRVFGTLRHSNGAYATATKAVIYGEWAHYAVVFDRNTNVLKLYVDGELLGSTPISSFGQGNYTDGSFYINYGSVYGGNGPGSHMNCFVDDVRVYDHALSPKEVKELAKAKILHYKFDDMQEPTRNLISDSFFLNSSIPSNTSGGQFGNWYFGTWSGDRHELIQSEGNPSAKALKVTATSASRANDFWCLDWRDSVPANTVHTISFYCKGVGSIEVKSHWGGTLKTIELTDSLTRHEITTMKGSIGTQYVYIACASLVVGQWLHLEMPQCELKDHATLFTPNERTGTVHDSSGYDNHAELALATTPRWVGSESSKIGSGAYEFDGVDDYIKVYGFRGPSDVLTLSAWVNLKSYNSDRSIVFRKYNGFYLSVNSTGKVSSYWYGTSSPGYHNSTSSVPLNTWCHIASVWDGSHVKLYLNGALDKSIACTTPGISNDDYMDIGFDDGGGGYRYIDGKIDDLRIYATALSDEDIKELYQTRGNIDSHGNLYVQEVLETGHKPLIANYTLWQNGQTGSISPFSQNGSTSENYRILGCDPWGKETVLWEARPAGDATADGGWNMDHGGIDPTKLYRYSVWAKRSVQGNGSFYLGTMANQVATLAGVTSSNPYFYSGGAIDSEWQLYVGHVHPHNYTGGMHPDSGRYKVGGRIGSISADFKWLPTATTGRHRSYLYYSSDTNTRQQWCYPRVDICDGTEPSIQELLNGFDSRYIDYVRAKGEANPITLDVGDQSSMFGTIREVGLPVRYIRDWANGSTSNTGNHWVEIEAYSGGVNVALGKSATSPILTDGAVASSPYYSQGSGLQSVQVDLGEVCIVEVINVRHYYADGRTYHNTKTEVSADGVNWVTVFDSAIEGEYPETSAGNTIICRPQSFALGASGDAFIRELKEV